MSFQLDGTKTKKHLDALNSAADVVFFGGLFLGAGCVVVSLTVKVEVLQTMVVLQGVAIAGGGYLASQMLKAVAHALELLAMIEDNTAKPGELTEAAPAE
jgi:hypothetical protein